MSREWQPGDVASVRFGTSDWETAIFQDGGEWACQHRHDVRGRGDVQARPLVVINPDDREQVDRLVIAWLRHGEGDFTDQMQAALHSLIEPPKPDEPLGLGAVVVDAVGRRWVRDVEGADSQGEWYRRGLTKPTHYVEITAVRVLSEGVVTDA